MDDIENLPGRVHDARMFHNSQLYTKGERGDPFEDSTAIIDATRVPAMVLADPAYPLWLWLMKQFINTGSLDHFAVELYTMVCTYPHNITFILAHTSFFSMRQCSLTLQSFWRGHISIML